MDVLAKLFGSEAKVKIMRLFLFNPDQPFSATDIATRAKVSRAAARHEVSLLRKMGMIVGKRFVRMVSVKRRKKRMMKRKKEGGWVLKPDFSYLPALQKLLLNTALFKQDALIRKLSSVGRLKLVVLAGVFIHDSDSRVDILVVGDNLRFGALQGVVRTIESEIGKELRYAAFETADFNYRLSMYDKLVRDILDYPHRTVVDRIGLPAVL